MLDPFSRTEVIHVAGTPRREAEALGVKQRQRRRAIASGRLKY